jgi:hypothetical protein
VSRWLLLVLLAPADHTPPGPPRVVDVLPETTQGESVNGLHWSVRMRRTFTVYDSVPCEWGLVNSGKGKVAVEFALGGATRAVLSGDNGDFQAKEVEPKGHELLHPSSGDTFRGHSPADLRVPFGRLTPGLYTLELILPAAAYSLKEEASFKPAELRSGPVRFRVVDTSPERAEAANRRSAVLDFRVSSRVVDPEDAPTGTLTNTGGFPLAIQVAIGEDDAPKRAVHATWQRWSPPHGWAVAHDAPDGIRVNGVEEGKLAPGERRTTPLVTPSVDGVYRYVVYTWDERTQPPTRVQGVSNVFVVERRPAK